MAAAVPSRARPASLQAQQARLHALRPQSLQVRSGSQDRQVRLAVAVRCESQDRDTGKATSNNALAGVALVTSFVAMSESAQAADVEKIRDTLEKVYSIYCYSAYVEPFELGSSSTSERSQPCYRQL